MIYSLLPKKFSGIKGVVKKAIKQRACPPLGAHVSTSQGIYHAWEHAAEIAATCMQVFTANQRQWSPKSSSDEDVKRFRDMRRQSAVKTVMSHDSYLINLCSPDAAVQTKSVKAFAEEIDRCLGLGVELLNFHPGSHKEKSAEWGLKTIAKQLDKMRPRYQGKGLTLLLETTAGQGTNLGWRFEQLAEILKLMKDSDDVGVCVDTCHIFAAGYDIRSQKAWEKTWQEFDQTIGLKRLKAFHLNDSKFGLSSRRDRHEEIGKGHIGLEAFRLLVNDARFSQLPMILETPCDLDGYGREIKLLRSLVGKAYIR